MILINQLVYVAIGPSSFRAATFPSTRGRHRDTDRRDGRHGTSVSLSRRVVTHHLSARTDRFFVGCVFVFTSTARRADARSRPSISPIDAPHACTLASSIHRHGGPKATTLDDARGGGENERRRERRRGDERTVSIESARACARGRGSNRTHRTHRTNPSNPSVGRLTIDPSNRIHSFARSFRFIHRSSRRKRDDDEKCDDRPA